MTRQEEIDVAKREFHQRILDEGLYYDPRDCFEEGAEWADNNPNLSLLWHDASEEPQENMDILSISKNGKLHKISKIDNQLYDWLKSNDNIKKWAYIKDILPK